MAASEYYIPDMAITGTPDNPQTITFGALTDMDGNPVPSYFGSNMVVVPGAPNADIDVHIVSKDGATFDIAMSGAGVSAASVNVGFLIAGELNPFYIVVLRD